MSELDEPQPAPEDEPKYSEWFPREGDEFGPIEASLRLPSSTRVEFHTLPASGGGDSDYVFFKLPLEAFRPE